jgi:hypothetical protein
VQKLHCIIVAGEKSIELMFEIERWGYAHAASTANCGRPAEQYEVMLIDWRKRTFRSLETTLDWLVDFLHPDGIVVVLNDRQKAQARECVNAEGQSLSVGDDSEDHDRHLTLLSRAITANLDGPETSDADFASAFIALVNAASDTDNVEGEEFDEEQASLAWQSLEEHLRDGYTNRQGGFARLMYGETKPQVRRMMQLAFNRSNSFPRVLVAQSLVGREGLNLHESCRIVVLLHPEWNPGVVEQQIGRVDRVNCRWAKELNDALVEGKTGLDLPRIEIRPVIFKGTYDEHNWKVLQERWDDLRAQLHSEAIPARLRVAEDDEGRLILNQIAQTRPDFSPLKY